MTIVGLAEAVEDQISISGKITSEDSVSGLVAANAAWLYQTPDEGDDWGVEPGGFETLKNLAGGKLVARQIVVRHKVLDLALAEESVAAVSELPRPLLISCRSATRAGAVLTLWYAKTHNLGPEQALEYATQKGFTFVKNAYLRDWVTAAASRWTHRLPPLFRQLFESESSTYTYILADPHTKEAVIIDSVDLTADRDLTTMTEMGLHPLYALSTHVHADHITGNARLKKQLPGLQSVISEASKARSDVKVHDGDRIRFGGFYLEVRATPGHTNGCVSFVLDDRSAVFTGDALLIRGCGRTDFQEGDSSRLYTSVHEKIFSLPNDAIVYPAHDYKGRTSTSVGEEKLYNPRLTKPLDEFVTIMATLGLPYPKKIDQSLPANMVCGFSD